MSVEAEVMALKKEVAALRKEVAEVKKAKGKRVKRAPTEYALYVQAYLKKNKGASFKEAAAQWNKDKK